MIIYASPKNKLKCIYIIAIWIQKEILGAPAWGDFQMILASFFVFSFFWEWASSQHVASFLLLKNYKINKNFSIELLLVCFRMKELMGQLLVLRAYKLLGTIKYKIVQTTWNNREIRTLRLKYLPPACSDIFLFF